jgi:type IV pilus assembly protein PilY1
MQGKILMQVSTGALAEVTLATAFGGNGGTTNEGEKDRKTLEPIPGMPPSDDGIVLITNPKPVKKILHYQEK